MFAITPRQIECLRLLMKGMTSKQIALEIGLSEETINEHIANAQKRLGAKNRLETVIMAVKAGYLEL